MRGKLLLLLLVSGYFLSAQISFFNIRTLGLGVEKGFYWMPEKVDESYTDVFLTLSNKGHYLMKVNYSLFDDLDFDKYSLNQKKISKANCSVGILIGFPYHSAWYLKPMIGLSYVNWAKHNAPVSGMTNNFTNHFGINVYGEIGYQHKIGRSYLSYGLQYNYTRSLCYDEMKQVGINLTYSYVARQASYE